jgi:hypothetical protein
MFEKRLQKGGLGFCLTKRQICGKFNTNKLIDRGFAEENDMRGRYNNPFVLVLFCLFVSIIFSSLSFGIWFDVWDNPRQCHGDADGKKSISYWVNSIDLSILNSTLPWPCYAGNPRYLPEADFTRDLVIDGDIEWGDVAAITPWLGKTGVPTDCPGKLSLHSMAGSKIPGGSIYVISWDDLSGSCSDGTLSYSADNGSNWNAIDPNYKDGCSCYWPVPDVNSSQCLIKISYDGHHPLVPWTFTDTTGTFTIYECQLETNSDKDGSCYIDSIDFAIIAQNWLGTDLSDVNELAQHWLNCGNPYDPLCGVN